MMRHLNFSNEPPPVEYLELLLWREYGCDPRTVDVRRVMAHLTCIAEENRYKNQHHGK